MYTVRYWLSGLERVPCGLGGDTSLLEEHRVVAEAMVWPGHRLHVSCVFPSVPALGRPFPDSVPPGSTVPSVHRGNPAVQVGSQPGEEAVCPLSLKHSPSPRNGRE